MLDNRKYKVVDSIVATTKTNALLKYMEKQKMGSDIIVGLILYAIEIGIMWFGNSLNNFLGNIIFWAFFVLSSLLLFRLYGFIRSFFIIIFSKCHEIDQDYIDEEMRKYEESLKVESN